MKPADRPVTDEYPATRQQTGGRRLAPHLLVVGYVRADSDELAAPLETAIRAYAEKRDYVLIGIRRDAVDGDEVGRSAFWRCMAAVYRGEVQVIVIPTWDHLARNELRRRTMLTSVHRAGALVDLIDAREPRRPAWSVAPAADPALAPAVYQRY